MPKIENLAEAKQFFKMHSRAHKTVIAGVLNNVIVQDDGHIFVNHPDPVKLKASVDKGVNLFQVIPATGDIFTAPASKKPKSQAQS